MQQANVKALAETIYNRKTILFPEIQLTVPKPQKQTKCSIFVSVKKKISENEQI